MAEQTVESSVAGMLTAVVPLATAGVAFALGQRSLRPVHVVGLVGGLIGVILLGLPSVTGARPAILGVAMVLLAVLGYALNGNVLVPLAQKYGGIRVIFHAQLIGVVLLAPFGLHSLGSNQLETGPILALLSLGILSTGASRVVHASMGSRVGAPRASIVGYLLPVVALILGVVFRGDTVSPSEVAGLVVVLGSALLVTRAVQPHRLAP
jgi:drug/metabolite transporter (DMT)-like permease